MAISAASIPLAPAPGRPDSVEKALQQLYIARNVWVRRLFSYYPLIVAAVLAADWLLAQGSWVINRLPELLSYLAVAAAAMLFVRLYGQLPETLRALWDRGCLSSTRSNRVVEEEFVRFIERFDRDLNGPWSWAAGIATLLIARLALWSITPLTASRLVPLALGSLSYFMDGLALWKLVAVATNVTRLSNRFIIAVQPTHPDQSGGLGPLGDLCFTNALILLGPALYFTAWVVLTGSSNLLDAVPGLHEQVRFYQTLLDLKVFHLVLIGLLLLEVVVFLLPLLEIHREMVRQVAKHRQMLDALARQIDQINRELLGSTRTLETAEANKRLDTLKWIQQVYDSNTQTPTWPFNRSVVLKLVTSQVIPLLSLTGLGKPVLDLIGSLTGQIH